jgi:hypothetical protein
MLKAHCYILSSIGILVFGPSGKSKTRPVEECCFKTYVHADMHADIHARVRTCIHPHVNADGPTYVQ